MDWSPSHKPRRLITLSAGLMYLDGQGVEKSKDKAIEWLQKAADKGNSRAKEKLSELEQQ